MEKKGLLTKILAVAGTILSWFPILAPILIYTVRFIQIGRFRFDYLMPAELFPFTLIGGVLLIWAALRARSHWKLICGGFIIALFVIIGGQTLAVVTGLASGEIEPPVWIEPVTIAVIAVYVLALAAAGVGGIFLLRDLFKQQQLPF